MEKNEKYNLTQFENATAYFQDCGSGAIIDGKWNLFTYMNTQEYDEDVHRLEQNIFEIESHCENKSVNACQKTVVEMHNMMKKIDGFHQAIKTNLETRRKRALGVVGAIGYSFFGTVLGYITGKLTEKIIGNIQNAEIEGILDQQASVLEILNDEVMSIRDISEKGNEREEAIDWTITYVITSLARLHETQRMVLAMLGNEKRLTPGWLRPDELAAQIQMISDNLPENARLIGNNMNERIWSVYQFAEIKTIATDQALVIVIEIPLIGITKYNCFEIIPLPFQHDGESMSISNIHKYVWIGQDEIYLPRENELNTCKGMDGEYYCKQTSGIIITHEDERCEWQLFTNKTALNCSTANSVGHEQWVRLKDDTWLFLITEKTEAEIDCDGEKRMLRLNTSGSIIFKNNCKIETKKSKIWKQQIVASAAEKSNIQVHTVQWPASIVPNFEAKAKKTLIKLKNTDEALWWHSIHHYIAIYVIVILIFVLSCLFVKKIELEPIP